MTTLFSLAFSSALLFASASLVQAGDWAHEYSPNALPEQSIPRWNSGAKKTDTVAVGGGKLNVTDVPDKGVIYTIGTYEGGIVFGDGAAAWDASAGLATVEFRLKCESENPEAEVFRVALSDGKSDWVVLFGPHSITVPRTKSPVTVDTTQADTYRISLKEGKMAVSSSQQGVLFADVPGSPFKNLPTRNRLLFGTSRQEGVFTPVTWELDFIRWTNKETPPKQP